MHAFNDKAVCPVHVVTLRCRCFEGDVERALVRTPVGTHCCFYEGKTLWPRSSWATDASLEFFNAVLAEEGQAKLETPVSDMAFS